MNAFLDLDKIKQRLENLEQGAASNAIEDIHVSEKDMAFLKELILMGKTDDEMVQEILKKYNLESG